RIIKTAAEKGKRVIIATHLLESMVENPIPTRAEVTDVANAVYEEADCVMLSAETSVGKYPIKSVEMLDKICRRIERSGGIGWAAKRKPQGVRAKLSKSAVDLGDQIHADAIFVFTRRGIMASHVAACHPKIPPIFAFTNMTTVRRKLIMMRSCYPFRIDFSKDPEKTIQNAMKAVLSRKLLPEGATIVIVSDILTAGGAVDAIQVRPLELPKSS
ncbi:MAG: pyruvate kinase, partial [Candidatus Hydrogenedentota bacterium]